MLQQTQVATVIPYFYRFIEKFPTINHLAQADIDEVLALWSGLGYYARARNLHRTAQIIVSAYAGIFPKTIEALESLPGIGRSTAGAILSQSFNLFGVILDGNVKRVLTRYLTLQPNKKQAPKQFETLLWEYATYFTPQASPKARNADYTQAIMDLGALICTRTQPKCTLCPLKKNCAAHLTQTQANYPVKPPKKIKPTKQAKWLIISAQQKNQLPRILLCLRPSKGIWGGLWSFPEYPIDSPTHSRSIASWLKKTGLLTLPNSPSFFSKLEPGSHVFTHFKLEYEPILIQLPCSSPEKLDSLASQQTKWYNPAEITQIGLPSPVTKILNQIGFFNHDSNVL